MMPAFVARLRRIARKPPGYIARRLVHEAGSRADRYFAPLRARRCTLESILAVTGDASLDALWLRLAASPYPAYTEPVDAADYERCCPGDRRRILDAAELALRHRVDLMGSGPVDLGAQIDWQCDYKTGIRWPPGFCKSIDFMNLERPSDVKFPWENSRKQWLMPVGQAYLLSGDEKYARAAREVLEQWIDGNPYAWSVNWACTMEVALRIVSWTWFFRVFHRSAVWADQAFREKFLCALYLHGEYTARYLEKSDINGNHYTADAAGLVFAGLFWGRGDEPQRWARLGWSILCSELPKQVFADGVDFEASVPYHRLVQELFLFPALYRRCLGQDIALSYRERFLRMAEFSCAYTRLDGMVPLWGDADDARTLPFGGQALNDHRYLIGLAALGLDAPELIASTAGPRSEAFWAFGPDAMARLPERELPESLPKSVAFVDGGFYVMRNARDHVFIACGPRGLGGRGGHGHNDLLSFEAALDGVHLVSDCGAFIYTGDYRARNRFRSTASHNTPQLAGEEINRFVRPDHLWDVRPDAEHRLIAWQPGASADEFCGEHTGYLRLGPRVLVRRRFRLDHAAHQLQVSDELQGEAAECAVSIPLHLAPGVTAERVGEAIELRKDGRAFRLDWSSDQAWNVEIGSAEVSPSYGVAIAVQRIAFHAPRVPAKLSVTIAPLAR